MPKLLILHVHVPAQRVVPPNQGGILLDPVPLYQGNWLPPDGSRPPVVGIARILSGVKADDRFINCLYISPGYHIPGRGEIEIIELGG